MHCRRGLSVYLGARKGVSPAQKQAYLCLPQGDTGYIPGGTEALTSNHVKELRHPSPSPHCSLWRWRQTLYTKKIKVRHINFLQQANLVSKKKNFFLNFNNLYIFTVCPWRILVTSKTKDYSRRHLIPCCTLLRGADSTASVSQGSGPSSHCAIRPDRRRCRTTTLTPMVSSLSIQTSTTNKRRMPCVVCG